MTGSEEGGRPVAVTVGANSPGSSAPVLATPYLQDADFTLYCGDALETLRELPAESVHMCVTSPPFYGLRDYGTGAWEGGDEGCDHTPPKREHGIYKNGQGQAYASSNTNWDAPHKSYGATCGKCGARRVDRQIGLEATPDEWVARLIEVFREVRRVLRKDGTLWLEIGDSYGSGPGSNRDIAEFPSNRNQIPGKEWGSRGGQRQQATKHPYKPKDLIGAPWLLAFALRADGWWLRSEIIWAKPNPMPESVSDRPTTSHSRVFLLTRSPRYFFDAEAVREPHSRDWSDEFANGKQATEWMDRGWAHKSPNQNTVQFKTNTMNPAGRNVRSVWTIATQPLPDEHYAAFPEKLVERCILAGTSERGVCPECGAPWERVVESRSLNRPDLPRDHPEWRPSRYDDGKAGNPQAPGPGQRFSEVTTTGWRSTCDCQVGYPLDPLQPVPATVLDPFVGSGTTALVARRLGRRCLGIELSEKYCEMAARRTRQLSLLATEGEGA